LTNIQLSDERTFSFEAGTKQLSLKAIQEIESYRELESHPQIVSVNIPLDPTQSGTLVIGSVASITGRLQQWIEWSNTRSPGENVPITHIGIRKGAMVSMDAYATRLALETPYISLPAEIYDILVQATNPTPQQHGSGYDDVVDCSALERFPDLVLGLEPEAEEEDDDEAKDNEIVITPKQYILQTEEGHCILLAQRTYQRDREEVVLGWAAIRGRNIVLDRVNERTGFGTETADLVET
jgi:hypothetical protein